MTLVTIRPGVAFQQPAAESFQRYEHALGRPADVNRTTVSWDAQMVKYRAYLAYLAGGPWAPLALHPSKTKHVYRPDDPTSATAWDTDEHGDQLLEEHGWIADVADELWHREYRWWCDQHRHEGIPAAVGATPIPPSIPIQGDDMSIIIVAASAGGFIKKGMAFADNLTEPLTVLTAKELEALDYAKEHQGIPYRKAVWDAPTILKLINERGIRPQTGPAGAAEYTKVNY